MESVLVGHVRQHAHNSLSAARSGVASLSARLHQIRANRRYSDEAKREQVAHALAEDGASIRGAVEDVRVAVGRHLQNADARIESVRAIAPDALSERREALKPFLDRAFEDRSVLSLAVPKQLRGSRGQARHRAARRIVHRLRKPRGDPSFAEEWRGLQEELAPQRPPEELQALEDQEALGEIQGYLDDGAALLEIDLAGLRDGGASAEQMMNRPFLESRINGFEDSHGLPSSQPGAMRPEQLLDGEEEEVS